MSEIANLLRLGAPAVKEIATQKINVAALISGEIFTSALTLGYSRKTLYVYNLTHANSGEVYIGPEGVTPLDGMVIKKGEWIPINIGSDLDFYLVAGGAGSNLRVMELA